MEPRIAGQGRYAQTEREQRWLMGEVPEERSGPVQIKDLYLSGTRLRLRRMSSGDDVTFKLCQKVRIDEGVPELVKITNIYLDAVEYGRFATLPARVLEKVRWRSPHGSRLIAVDVFGGPLTGLVLAEAELAPRDELLEAPPQALRDVTYDERFTGGALATLDQISARELLDLVGQWSTTLSD